MKTATEMGMRVKLRSIEIFVRVVERGSFAAAARSLLIDPAVVSRAVSALEHDLGCTLFTRTARAMRLTREGNRFFREGKQLLASIESVVQGFKVSIRGDQQIKVGLGPALNRRLFFRQLPAFQEAHPALRLVVLGVNDRTEVGDEGIDILIRPQGVRRSGSHRKESQGLIVRKLFYSPTVICASPAYLKRYGTPRVPADLKQHRCMALLTLERNVLDEWPFVKAGARETVQFEPVVTAHGEALREALLAGCGIARVLACHVDEELQSGQLVRLLPDWESLGGLPVTAIYRNARPSILPVRALANHLVNTFSLKS